VTMLEEENQVLK